jgi:hypothetical protein
MSGLHRCCGAVAIACVAAISIASAPNALAQSKKLTYEQAYAACKKELDAGGVYGVNLDAKARYTAGAGCMKKYGLRLKRKTKF